MATKRKLTTTAQGLGYRHQQARASLMRQHTNGRPCEWCSRPMYDDTNRHRNYDHNPTSTNPDSGKLHADHSRMSRTEAVRRGLPIPRADRLLHGACNIQRGNGGNDHLATNTKPATTDALAMPWPWHN
jgi:hypothetical protein